MTVKEISLYHLTHIQNLEGIIASGLLCDKKAQGRSPRSIAYGHLKAKRQNCRVPLAPGGVVADYAPFHFAPCSPMLYAIFKGYVPNAPGQSQIVYLVTTVGQVLERGLPCVFTDRHPLSPSVRFYNNPDLLPQVIRWDIMRSEYWHDTWEIPNRKSLRQAEFLVHDYLPWECVVMIGVYDSSMLQHVQSLLQNAPHKPVVQVCRRWYY